MTTKLTLAATFSLALAASATAAQPVAPAASSATASAAAGTATVALKPGLWETTGTTENVGASSRRSVVGRSCVVAAEATNPQRIVPIQREPGMQCENRDIRREGANWVWTISCKSADATQNGSGKMSIFADSYLGRAEVELRKKGAKPVKLGQTFSGKWIQACS